MKVILLEDVKALGKKGQVVNVNDGYARNFILPKKLGVEATNKNMNDLKLQKANQDKVAAEKLADAKVLAEKLEKSSIEIKIKAGTGDKVFGSISAKEIAAEVSKQLGLEVDKKKVQLPEPIKTMGEHTVTIKLHTEVTATLKVEVKPL
ncbi:MAG: 50S ribosomal protein L9 [Lachnospiraceae bacterium]|nr:50S ribosomal protein L9 [Lachnospiraceae bacterium]